jgi:hypothetical protein
MKQYVCLRITRMDEVNIALFDYDRYNTLYFFILNANEDIYMRYGGREADSQETYLTLDSLELALRQGLDVHEQYKKGAWKPQVPKPQAKYPHQIPLLYDRTFARNNCVECHLIGDFENQHREIDGTLDKVTHMYRSPDLRTIGIDLDIPKGIVISKTSGPAAQAGLQPGDRLTSVNGIGVWTFGDLQYFYDKVDRKATSVRFTADRAGKVVEANVALPKLWWKTDIRYRQWSVDPRVYFDSDPLTEAQKKELGLKPGGFASRVKYVSGFAKTMKAHELQVGDVITAVDGVETDPDADTADFFIRLRRKAGDAVKLTVLRDGKRIEMPLTSFRLSFRK